MSAITNDGSSIIQQEVSLSNSSQGSYRCLSRHLDEYTIEQFDTCYKIKESVDIIIKNGFKNVALQFPDELLSDASLISFQLKYYYMKFKSSSSSEENNKKEQTSSTSNNEPLIGDIEDFNQHSTLSLLSQLSINSEFSKTVKQTEYLRVYILGDTSYGSCCVDEVGAQHMLCDFIIHYGNACLQPVKRTPVFHVFGMNYKLNINECLDNLNRFVEESNEGEVIVIYDLINYERIKKELIPLVDNTSNRIVFSRLYDSRVLQNVVDKSSSVAQTVEIGENENKISNQIFPKPSEKARFFFIGELGSFITQFMVEYNTHSFKVFSGYKNKIESDGSGNISRTLGRRFAMVQKAKEAQVFGILVATISVENYLKMVEYVKRLIIDNNRKFYLFFVGKLNVPKLANFMEIDMFVLIGCSQNSLIESREYVKPIITPFELELALKYGKEWTGYYQLDYNRIFEDDCCNDGCTDTTTGEEEDRYEVSLMSGSIYRVGKSTASSKEVLLSNDDGKSLILQQQQQNQLMETQYTPSMLYLKSRIYKGLGQDAEDETDETTSQQTYASIEKGKTGIASNYVDEPKLN